MLQLTTNETNLIRKLLNDVPDYWQGISRGDLTELAIDASIIDPASFVQKCNKLGIGSMGVTRYPYDSDRGSAWNSLDAFEQEAVKDEQPGVNHQLYCWSVG